MTTEDMIFEWQIPDVHGDPLVLVPGIELPQLNLIKSFTGDCTAVYSTGWLQAPYEYVQPL